MYRMHVANNRASAVTVAKDIVMERFTFSLVRIEHICPLANMANFSLPGSGETLRRNFHTLHYIRNDEMKTVKPKGLLESISFYGIILINVLIIFLPIPGFIFKLGAFIVGNAMFYSGGVTDHYLFEYNQEKLVIRNTWNPFFYQGYWIKSLNKIELDYFNGAGHGVIIFLDNERKVYIYDCDKAELKRMVEEIKGLI